MTEEIAPYHQQSTAITYSVVICTFNSEETLLILHERIQKIFKENIKAGYEILFIDDASQNPKTWDTLKKIQTIDPSVKIVRLTRNFGQQAATLCGLEIAKGEYIITMDDDLQHAPEDIPLLIQKQEHDIVVASFKNKQHGFFKKLNSSIKGKMDEWLIGKPANIRLSSFRMIRKDIAENMLRIYTPFPYIPALMLYVTRDIVNAEAQHGKRAAGSSGYSTVKLLKLFSNLLINNSSALLKFIGAFGITISMLSFLTMIYFVIKKLTYGIEITGWTSLMAAVLGIGGLLLFSVGILGEYLVRLIAGAEKRPAYIIREIRGDKL